MEWSKFKLGVGPMSPEVIESCLHYSHIHNYPLMIIASRNQVDYQSGYVFRTEQLSNFIKSNKYYDPDRIKICRDHCGPGFSDNDKKTDFETVVNRCKRTIEADIANGFDLLHIDVSRTDIFMQETIARELIEHAISLNPEISLEFGSEDNTGQNLNDTIATFATQVKFAKQYEKNIVFLVSQTGSLTKHTQVGTFDLKLSYDIAQQIHSNGFLFKEHNADYLTIPQVRDRFFAGVDAVNIAPQLGYVHSCVLNKLGYNYKSELENFKQYVLEKEYWKKWVIDSVQDSETKFLVSAHYCYNSEYAQMIQAIIKHKNIPFKELLLQEISLNLDQYRLGFGVD